MILVSFHTGGGAPLNVLLTRLPARVLVLQYEPDRSPPLPGVERVRTAGGELARALAAKRAGDFLRAGGFVFMMLDRGGFTMLDRGGGAYTPIEVFNGRFFVSSGAFRLAQLTRAPILPVIAEWRGRGGEIRLGRPIAPAGEAEMSNMLAMWLEDLLPAGQARSKLISSLSG
jgi:lauroyl/myristoyl acyltransferase